MAVGALLAVFHGLVRFVTVVTPGHAGDRLQFQFALRQHGVLFLEIVKRIRLPKYIANGDYLIDLGLNQPLTQDFFRAGSCMSLHIEGFYDPYCHPLILRRDGFIGLESE